MKGKLRDPIGTQEAESRHFQALTRPFVRQWCLMLQATKNRAAMTTQFLRLVPFVFTVGVYVLCILEHSHISLLGMVTTDYAMGPSKDWAKAGRSVTSIRVPSPSKTFIWVSESATDWNFKFFSSARTSTQVVAVWMDPWALGLSDFRNSEIGQSHVKHLSDLLPLKILAFICLPAGPNMSQSNDSKTWDKLNIAKPFNIIQHQGEDLQEVHLARQHLAVAGKGITNDTATTHKATRIEIFEVDDAGCIPSDLQSMLADCWQSYRQRSSVSTEISSGSSLLWLDLGTSETSFKHIPIFWNTRGPKVARCGGGGPVKARNIFSRDFAGVTVIETWTPQLEPEPEWKHLINRSQAY